MLTQDEKRFVEYWKNNREKEKKTFRQLIVGLPIGLTFAVAIIAFFISGWYERAAMVAYSQSSPIMFLVAIAAIIAFIAIFSKKHKWDMNEQQYQELLKKEERMSNSAAKDHQL
jgi:hypothetical protein